MATRFFPSHLREMLVSWFQQYGANERMEIEFRVRDVGEAGFERILSSLLTHRGWSNTPAPMVTVDVMHASGVRETRVPGSTDVAPEYLRKEKGPKLTHDTDVGYGTRFEVSQEVPTSADASPVHVVRHKQRFTFVHKGLFKFELTRVKQGTTDQAARQAPTTFEVELEFCGQASGAVARPEYLADSMLMKAADLVERLSHAGSSAGGPLGEGDDIVLKPDTAVVLGPSGHGTKPRYEGEMPAELAQRVEWLYSHKEPDGSAYIMSKPTKGLGELEHFPLFYFCGTVPHDAVRKRT